MPMVFRFQPHKVIVPQPWDTCITAVGHVSHICETRVPHSWDDNIMRIKTPHAPHASITGSANIAKVESRSKRKQSFQFDYAETYHIIHPSSSSDGCGESPATHYPLLAPIIPTIS